MALFPRIQSPCPYKGRLSAVMDGDFCRLCERRVFDLTHMTDGERVAFIAGCAEEVCVSYRLRPALAAAALAAAAVPAAAAAQDLGPAVPDAAAIAANAEFAGVEQVIVMGGIKDPRRVHYVEHQVDNSVPELPVVYEDRPARAPAPTAAPARAPVGP
jgi:predicted Fe-S protein YdhL (DUF1289 family)